MGRPVRLASDPVGTSHRVARCCWCRSPLVIAQIAELQNIASNTKDRCWVCPNCWRRQVQWAVMRREGKGKVIYHVPLPSQVLFYESKKPNRLWGGKAGPGKSVGVRWFLYRRSLHVPGHEALLLRENWDQLRANHTLKMAIEVPLLGGRWLETDRMAVFGKGSNQSLIHCGHMAELESVTRYLGIEYGAIVPEEASLYPVTGAGVTVLAELSTRARKEYVDLDGQIVPPVFLPVTNPGGPSAPYLNDMFIDHAPDFEKFPALRPEYDDETGEQIAGYRAEDWEYLPAALEDNPYMREDYKATVLANLSEVRYKQLALGDWSAFDGQFFPEWDERHHVRTAIIAA